MPLRSMPTGGTSKAKPAIPFWIRKQRKPQWSFTSAASGSAAGPSWSRRGPNTQPMDRSHRIYACRHCIYAAM